MEPITFTARKHPLPNEVRVAFGLQLVGSLPVHSLTTMPMLPWVVAEVRRLSGQPSRREPGTKQVRLCVSPSGLRCEPEPGKTQQWDPLICCSIFECKPQHVHKLIHNSHDPSYFACLIKDDPANRRSVCYVFKADDQTKACTGPSPCTILASTSHVPSKGISPLFCTPIPPTLATGPVVPQGDEDANSSCPSAEDAAVPWGAMRQLPSKSGLMSDSAP